jgi:glutathione S-transferase
MLTLFQGPRAWGQPNFSPFCTKLETYLRMAEIPHEVKLADMRRAPKGKIPYVELDGQCVGDSSHIIELLEERFGQQLDGALDARQKAQGRVIQRTLEEATYFVEVYHRWLTANFPLAREALLGGMGLPKPAVLLIGAMVQRKQRRTLYGQGISRHHAREIYACGTRDFAALSALLGERPFLFGERPSSYDAVLYAFTLGAFRTPFADVYGPCPANLLRFCERIDQRYFADIAPPQKREDGRGA